MPEFFKGFYHGTKIAHNFRGGDVKNFQIVTQKKFKNVRFFRIDKLKMIQENENFNISNF